jgi:hypothetical protein
MDGACNTDGSEFLTFTLDGGEIHAPSTLPPVPLDRKLGGSQSRSGRCGERKILHTQNRTVVGQPVA